jgi:hypothetical protein
MNQRTQPTRPDAVPRAPVMTALLLRVPGPAPVLVPKAIR